MLIIVGVIVILLLFALSIPIIGMILWQLGIFGEEFHINTATGFSELRVFDFSIKYETNGSLEFVVVNFAGTDLKNISAKFNGDCNGSMSIGDIAPAAAYKVSYVCAPKLQNESFETDIEFTYKKMIQGMETTNMSSGRISGTVG